jgi:transcriptional regulator with XRE-family HTH domain
MTFVAYLSRNPRPRRARKEIVMDLAMSMPDTISRAVVYVEPPQRVEVREEHAEALPAVQPSSPEAEVIRPSADRPLHRVGAVRRREGVSRRTIARHLGISIAEVQAQENPNTDLPLSSLYGWQRALGVPASELLENGDDEDGLAPVVQERARLVRVMKTVLSIVEQAKQTPIRRMAENLVEQLVEIMPELADETAWPTVGRRRSNRDVGQAFYRRLAHDVYREFEE